MEQWIIKGSSVDVNDIAKRLSINPVLVKIMSNRGIKEEDMISFLNPDIKRLNDASKLKDVNEACALLEDHSKKNSKVRIVGDYDIDGICATTILYLGLKDLGVNIDYNIPHREIDGYGININIIKRALNDGVSLIITCDNGIVAFEAIEYARENGIDVIVTDHHTVLNEGKDILPRANYIINPHREDDEYAYKTICGAYVAYKFVENYYAYVGSEFYKRIDLLMMAGVATVGDVMPLQYENRDLVDYCVDNIMNINIKGMKALFDVAGIEKDKVTSYTFGFAIGPMLNSAGRLEDASISVKLLTTDDVNEAYDYAYRLKELNVKRQELTLEGIKKSEQIIEKLKLYDNKIMVVYIPDVHESIVGIIAGRLREKYLKPVMVFTQTEDKEILKGSGRSIDSYDMCKNLREYEHLFEKLGGHKLAAGFSVKAENLDQLNVLLNEAVKDTEFYEVIKIDSILSFNLISVEFIELLNKLEPFGMSNEAPKFGMKNIKVQSYNLIGKNKNFLRLNLEDKGVQIVGLCFNRADELLNILNQRNIIDIVFELNINEWNNKKIPQIIIKNFR